MHGQSHVSLSQENPLEYAQRLCKLVNDSKNRESGLIKDAQTLDNLPSIIRKIYLKIREQLEDPDHPIILIIACF